MTSQHSMNKNTVSFRKLLGEALRHGNWMLALSALASFLFGPVCFLFVLQSWEHNYDYAAARNAAIAGFDVSRELAGNMADYLTGIHAWLQLMIVVVGALIVSVFGFRYLYHRRSADLYGSVPVSRGRQFLAQYLAGFLIWFVPFLIGNAFILLIGLSRIDGHFGIYAAALLKVSALMLFNFLIVYHACLVAVMLSGNTINALLGSGLYGITAGMVYLIFYLYCTRCFDTFYVAGTGLTQLFMGLSPLGAPFAHTCYVLIEGPADYPILLIVSGIMMAANFFLAKWLHSLRPSELAEHGLECKPVQILLRGIVSVGSGLLLGLFFGLLSDTEASGGWIMFGCIFGSALTFVVLNVVYHASFRELFAHKVQLVVCTALTVAIMLIFRLDLFGYDSYVASESQITQMALSCRSLQDDGTNYIWDEDQECYSYQYDDRVETVVSTDASEIYRALVAWADEPDEENGNYYRKIYVRVYTKTGSYCRTYRVYDTKLDTLATFLETDAYRDTYYPASLGSLVTPVYLYLYDYNNMIGKDYEIVDQDKIQALYEAYQADFLEHYSAELICSELNEDNVFYISFGYEKGYQPSLTVYPSFSRTRSLLAEWYPEENLEAEKAK